MKFNTKVLVLLCALFYAYPSLAAQKSYVLDDDYFGCCHQYGEIICSGKEADGENDSTCYYVENMNTIYEKRVVMNGIAFTYAYPSQRSNIDNPFNPNNKKIVYWIGFKNGKKNGAEIHYKHDYEQRKYKDWEQTWENGELLNRKEFYQGGKLSKETSYKNGVKNGSYIVYYPNGKPKIELDYKDDKLIDGEWKKYGITGKELIFGTTKDGKREGLWKFYSDETLLLEINYKNGKRDGILKSYYNGRDLERELNYNNGVKDGVQKYYNRNGTLAYEEHFKNGNPSNIWKKYDEQGKLDLEVDCDWVKRCPVRLKDGSLDELDDYDVADEDFFFLYEEKRPYKNGRAEWDTTYLHYLERL